MSIPPCRRKECPRAVPNSTRPRNDESEPRRAVHEGVPVPMPPRFPSRPRSRCEPSDEAGVQGEDCDGAVFQSHLDEERGCGRGAEAVRADGRPSTRGARRLVRQVLRSGKTRAASTLPRGVEDRRPEAIGSLH